MIVYKFDSMLSLAAGVTDHIPVDDNTAYMMVKRIHLKKNRAYETVNI